MTNYAGLVSRGQEIITDLYNTDLRDGVGDKDFKRVKSEEIKAIRKSCRSKRLDYKPQITFLKLFPISTRDILPVEGSEPQQPPPPQTQHLQQSSSEYPPKPPKGRLGRKTLYTATPLPFLSQEFEITLPNEDDRKKDDIARRVCIQPLLVIEFLSKHLSIDVSLESGLSESDCTKITNALRGVKVQVTHHEIRKKFQLGESGTKASLVKYLLEKYKYPIQYVLLPCLKIHTKPLNQTQRNNQLLRPHGRAQKICEIVAENNDANDAYAKEFGMKLCHELASVEARVLPPRWLRCYDGKCFMPEKGQWNILNKKMYDVRTVANWMCIAYYAHLVAYRGRLYWNAGDKELRRIKEEVEGFMFYC